MGRTLASIAAALLLTFGSAPAFASDDWSDFEDVGGCFIATSDGIVIEVTIGAKLWPAIDVRPGVAAPDFSMEPEAAQIAPALGDDLTREVGELALK